VPIQSQAQRGAMYSAAAGHSTIGIPKDVGKEFVASDKPGKLPERKKSRSQSLYGGKKSVKGYADGGPIYDTSSGSAPAYVQEADAREAQEEAAAQLAAARTKDKKSDGHSAGGKIATTLGKPVGKDDGMIPAQEGEYVIKKSAVQKLGTKVLDKINQGRIPHSSTLYGKKAVRRASA
jgi:hypothetical protein